MAPKSAQKPKAKKEDTPPPTPKRKAPAATPGSSKKAKKVADHAVYRDLPQDKNPTVPIDVAFAGTDTLSSKTDGDAYSHNLKLTATSGAFRLVKTFVIAEGEYAGMQAILVRPAKPFNFNGLPEETRTRIYRYYFAPNRVVGGSISLEGKRKSNGEVYAKLYADGSKNRVALLAVNKEIYEKARPVLYAHDLKFESTSTLMEFASNNALVRPHFTNITITTWIKTTAKTSMGLLTDARRFARLRVETGIYAEGDPSKASKQFYDAAYKFLQAVGAAKGDPAAGVDVLSFGRQALRFKDDKNVLRPWSGQLVEEFFDNLRLKLNPSA